MKLGKNGIDLSGVALYGANVKLEPGTYSATITAAELKETKAGGHAIIVDFLVDGQSTIKDFLNVINENEVAQRIGLSKLKSILTFGGHKNPELLKDTDELVGLKLGVIVNLVDESFKNEKDEMIDFKKNVIEGFCELDAEPKKEEVKKPVAKTEKVKENKEEASTEEKEFPW